MLKYFTGLQKIKNIKGKQQKLYQSGVKMNQFNIYGGDNNFQNYTSIMDYGG